jgi:hypothetical protein
MSKMRSVRARMGASGAAASKDESGFVEQPASAAANEVCSSPRRFNITSWHPSLRLRSLPQ